VDLAAVMQEVADRLDTIAGLRVYAHPVDKIEPPTALVSLPVINFDETYGRGTDRWTMPVILAVGKVVDRAARNNLAPFMKGSGTSSIKQVLETFAPVNFDSLRVQSATPDVITWSGIDYLTYAFTLDIIGNGA
jgi:hypothetical protein